MIEHTCAYDILSYLDMLIIIRDNESMDRREFLPAALGMDNLFGMT